eukprot:1674508-Ditylum_brightwellii.AAC.1
MENDILPNIEIAIKDAILSVLFDTCGDSRRLQTTERGPTERLEALGLSSLPRDAPLEEECQVNTRDPSNECTSVEGALTLLYRGTLSNEKTIILNTIEAGMKNGAFVSSHPAIAWITYIEERKDGTDNIVEGPEIMQTIQGVQGHNSSPPIYAFVLVAVFGLSVVGCIGLMHRMKNRRRNGAGDKTLSSDVMSASDGDEIDSSFCSTSDSEFDSETGEVDYLDYSIESKSGTSVRPLGSFPVAQPGSFPVAQLGSFPVAQPGSFPVAQPGSFPVAQPNHSKMQFKIVIT